MSAPARLTADPAYSWGALLMFAAAATVGIALGFEHLGGYSPCPLCLQERYAYYAAVPLSFLALVLGSMGQWRIAGILFLVVAAGFLVNTGLGVYHAGVEWKWWPGPDTCATAALTPLGRGGLLDSLQNTRVIRCDEAPWRFAGLSFAGWNAVISALLTLVAAKSAARALSR
jgi:disulfide bond formation protein DsbB